MLVTKSTSHQLIWLKILADGESVPLSLLAKIGGVSKTQAHNIVQWGKELQGHHLVKSHSKTPKPKTELMLNADKPQQNSESLMLGKVQEVISYLNLVTGKKFSATGADNTKYVMKLLKENYSFEDFKHVIDVKTAKWKGTNMDDYLRPQTLFGSKFNAYLNESINHGTKQTSSSIQQTIDTAQRVAESFDWGVDSE